MTIALCILLGVAIGVIIGWSLASIRRPAPPDSRLEGELREQVRLSGLELATARERAGERESARAAAEAAKAASDQTLAEQRKAQKECAEADASRIRDLEATLLTMREKLAENGAALSRAVAELSAEHSLLADLRVSHRKMEEAALDAAKQAKSAADQTMDEQKQLYQAAAKDYTRRIEALETVLVAEREKLAFNGSELATAVAELAAERTTIAKLNESHEGLKSSSVEAAASAVAQRMAAEAAFNSLREAHSKLGAEAAASQAQLKAERSSLAEARDLNAKATSTVATLQREMLELKTRNGALEESVKAFTERLGVERQQLESMQEKLHKEFEAVTNRLLVDNAARFSLQSAEGLEKILTPLRDNLTAFKASLESTRTETVANTALLKEQVSRIGNEAANLARALKGEAKVLGNWGENMLDQVLAKSGLQLGLHYRRQQGTTDIEGDRKILDVVVDLPDGRHLVIDSKVSMRSYEEAMNATDDVARSALLDKHVASFRAHFAGLGAAKYQNVRGVNSPDFVLMYVPMEGAFFAAVARDPDLWAEALAKDVIIITNSTLLATLRTVENVWRVANQQKHVVDIAERGGLLYDKFVGFVEDLQTIGKALRGGQDAWDAAFNKLSTGTGNLVGQADRLRKLGVKAKKALPALLLEKAAEVEELTPVVSLHP